MTSSRRWLLVPFVAVCAFLLGGPVFSQEPDPKTKGGGKAKSTAKADDAELAELKKSLTEARRELAAVKQSSANAAKASEETKRAAAEAPTKAEEAAQDVGTLRKDLGAKKGPTEEEQKATDELKKTAESGVAAAGEAKSKGDTAWMLTSSAFVMFMVPGLALFYGGMVRRKNVLATMMHSMAALAVVGLYWVAVGYALAFGPSVYKISLLGVEDGGVIGWSWDLFFLKGIDTDQLLPGTNIPVYVHMMFQGMFAIITPALISGAVAERIRFWPFCLFMILWVTFVYCPLAHMVWAFDWFDPTVAADKQGLAAIGLLGKMGALDFAGGTVVHIAAGMAGLAACLVLRRRDGYPKSVIHPNSMVLTLLGAGLLWFGWFGFNGGSAGASNAVGRVGVRRHPGGGGRGRAGVDAGRVAAQGQADRPGAGVRHRRRAGRGHAGVRVTSTSGAGWRSAWRPRSSATWPCTSRGCSGTTTRSTPSASTGSAGSSGRS